MNSEEQSYGAWTPDEWDMDFCTEMIGYLQQDLSNQPSLLRAKISAKMRGLTVEEYIQQRNNALEDKIKELRGKVASC